MKILLQCFLAALTLTSCTIYSRYIQPDSNNGVINLNSSWKFHKGDTANAEKMQFDDSKWTRVNIPHTWNTDLINGCTYYLGPAWYRRKLNITPEMMQKRLFLKFEGVGTVADVYLNGRKIGEHRGAYSAFCFEITGKVHEGENLIAVKADNSFNKNITPVGNRLFTRFGGVYRPVKLISKTKLCITPLDYASSGIYLKQKKVSEKSAGLDVVAKISNESPAPADCIVKITVNDADGKTVKTFSGSALIPKGKTIPVTTACTISSPHLWNGKKDPYLYSVTVELLSEGKHLDTVTQPLGFRYFRVDPKKGFFLNGKHLKLYGVCRHQEWEKEGAALTDAQHKHDIAEIYNLGAHAVRFAHYEQADIVYSECDKYGLVAWAEIPVTPLYKKENPEYFKNCRQQLIELIRQRFNHPSICFWGLYNEVHIPIEDVEKLYNLAKKEDSYRLVTAASNKQLLPRHEVTDVIAWNRYPFWYGGAQLSSFVSSIHKKKPQLCIGISEYGAGGCIDQHQLNPKRPNPTKGRFFPEEYQSIVHEKIWRDIKDKDDLWCTFIWNMFNFSWPTVTRGNRIHMNHKGLITYDRKVKKDAYYFYKANWSDSPVLYITSRRFTKRKRPDTYIKIYSNAPEVTIYLNGDKIGSKKPDDIKIVKWENIKLKKGTNIIRAEAAVNGKTITDKCEWQY